MVRLLPDRELDTISDDERFDYMGDLVLWKSSE